MPNPGDGDALKRLLRRRIDPLPAHRHRGTNPRSSIQDATWGTWGIFYPPSPSFLESQRHHQQAKGHKNAWPLFGVAQLPWNHPSRHVLDPMRPRALGRMFLVAFEGLEPRGMLAPLRSLSAPLVVALDGTQPFPLTLCSAAPVADGKPPMATPCLLLPRGLVSAWPPVYLMPQDGPDKQDGERAAGQRGMDQHAKQPATSPGGRWPCTMVSPASWCTSPPRRPRSLRLRLLAGQRRHQSVGTPPLPWLYHGRDAISVYSRGVPARGP